MSKDIEIGMIGTDFMSQHFELDEAVDMLYREAIRAIDAHYLPNPPFDKTGIICGVVTMNDFVEILVKYPEGILQLNKSEFFECNEVVADRVTKS